EDDQPADGEGQQGLEVALRRLVDLDPVEVAPRHALDRRAAVRAGRPGMVVGDHAVALHAVEVALATSRGDARRARALAVVLARLAVRPRAGARPVALAHVAERPGLGIVLHPRARA